MNVVELDVGNLWLWLQGNAPYAAGSGKLVNNTNQNGYILYFSDRRGMLSDPNRVGVFYNNITGSIGLGRYGQQLVAAGSPDRKLEPAAYYAFSPEDVDNNGVLDNLGAAIPGCRIWASSAPTNYMARCSSPSRPTPPLPTRTRSPAHGI